MSVEIWPPVAPDQLKVAVAATEKRELDWLIDELHETFTNLNHGLEDCYALLAPIDPGSTLVLSTPRNEIVKGHVTRIGTRIVKGTIHIRLRTFPHQTLTINPDHPIHLAPLTTLHSLLTHSIELFNFTLSYLYPSKTPHTPLPSDVSPAQFLSDQFRLLAQSLAEASALLRGPSDKLSDDTWTTRSAAPSHFLPPLQPPDANSSHPSLSFHLGIEDSSLVLWLRTLEPADAPLNFGTKLALAIGTARRLEHDETEKVFGYCCVDDDHHHEHRRSPDVPASASTVTETSASNPAAAPIPLSGTRDKNKNKPKSTEVFVREKLRVESADPSLLSLSSKLTALSHTLALARRNLSAVLGEEVDDDLLLDTLQEPSS
ncbi:RAVE subunit 2/Rogdi [Dichotomopilus funicola]|uniref:RAVE subunit 2/Rogdi n=1 Tax=Dichotomopilus funicola TaxID=1934379 RepID=A0AAN6UW50_9PEZI|nr:RAVE subunit 2/Rogdi [Dichotomopilus funicola]